MTKDRLYQELNYVNHSREKRIYYANLVLNNEQLIPYLIEILFKTEDKISSRAAWVLEFVCGKNLIAILPYLNLLFSEAKNVHLESSIRPIAKICEYLSVAYYKKKSPEIVNQLTSKHKENIIELCFNYMINNVKIAPKAYAMQSLYLLGSEFDWIHEELVIILEKDYENQSSGYKARARQIIQKIKK